MMKKKKQLIFFTLIFFICFSLDAFAINFSDVKSTSWFYENLELLVNQKVIDGFPDGTFRPDDNLKKDQYLKLLLVVQSPNYDFSVTSGYWFKSYMNRAYELKIIDSVGERKDFEVDISREEVSYLTYSMLLLEDSNGQLILDDSRKNELKQKIKDYNLIDSKYLDSILYLYDQGILSGFPDETFRPQEKLNRVQAVTIIAKIIKLKNGISLVGDNASQDEKNLDEIDLGVKLKVVSTFFSKDYSDEIENILD